MHVAFSKQAYSKECTTYSSTNVNSDFQDVLDLWFIRQQVKGVEPLSQTATRRNHVSEQTRELCSQDVLGLPHQSVAQSLPLEETAFHSHDDASQKEVQQETGKILFKWDNIYLSTVYQI